MKHGRRTLPLALVGVTALLGLGYLNWALPSWTKDPGGGLGLSQAQDVATQGASRPTVATSGEQRSSSAPVESAPAAMRQFAATSRLYSVLLGEDKRPISQAEVTWTPLEPRFFGAWVGWSRQIWSEVESASITVRSNAEGFFEIPLHAAQAELPAAIWITHTDFEPHLVMPDGASPARDIPNPIVLHQGQSTAVRVTFPDGSPAAAALIEQFQPIPSNGVADRFDPQAARVLIRGYRTDIDGRCQVAAWRGEMLLRAQHGSYRSEAWIGRARKQVQLKLYATFEVGGSVTLDPSSTFGGPLRVVGHVEHGPQIHVLDSAEVVDGAWGPLRLPISLADSYMFRLEGWGATMRDERVLSPAPNSRHRIDFHATKGYECASLAYDEAREIIRGAQAVFTWTVGGVTSTATARASDSEHGYMYLNGLPECTAVGWISAPGFIPTKTAPIRVSGAPLISHDVTLKRGGSMAGRVLYNNQPVENFSIISWQPALSNGESVCEFRSREDGSFEIEGTLTGQVQVRAAADGKAPSKLFAVELAPGQRVDGITLELTDGNRGFGRVVDEQTLQPIPRAVVQPYITDIAKPVAPYAAQLFANDAGEFDFPGLASGRARVRFSAPGYSPRWVETFRDQGELIDFGLVALHKAQTLKVRLLSSAPIDPTKFTLAAFGDDLIPETWFNSEGLIELQSIGSGTYTFHLIRDLPSGPKSIYGVRHFLKPGVDWYLELPAPSGREFTVHADFDASLGGPFELIVQFRSASGQNFFVSEPITSGERVRVEGALVGSYTVRLVSTHSKETLASRNGIISDADVETLVSITPSTNKRRFQVVNHEGAPVSAALLGLRKDKGTWSDIGHTDQAGCLDLVDIEPGDYFAYVSHADLGYAYDLPVLVGVDPSHVHEIEFEPKLVIEAVLQDGTTPLAGVTCKLWASEDMEFGQTAVTSNSSGLAAWTYFMPGKYFLKIDQPGYWSTQTWVDAREAGTPTTIQVRRLGNLEFEVKTASGLPIQSLPIQVRSLEFDASLASWLQAKRISASSATFETDSHGLLRIQGLPRGDYAWTIQLSSGEQLAGQVTVPSHSLVRLPLFVP